MFRPYPPVYGTKSLFNVHPTIPLNTVQAIESVIK